MEHKPKFIKIYELMLSFLNNEMTAYQERKTARELRKVLPEEIEKWKKANINSENKT
jgi:hypothetical protein